MKHRIINQIPQFWWG